MVATNALGPLYLSRAVARSMVKHGGCIVNIGSVVGSNGGAGQSAYSVSKSALTGLTKVCVVSFLCHLCSRYDVGSRWQKSWDHATSA